MLYSHRLIQKILNLLVWLLILAFFTARVSAADPDLAPYGSLLTRELTSGMSGEDVTALQSMLSRLGYLTKEVDGYFGPETRDAVIDFQEAHRDCTANGTVDLRTKNALNTKLCETSDLPGFLIYDAILQPGMSYTAKAYFDDEGSHEVVLSSESPHISISGMKITALSPGSGEVCAESEGKTYKFFISVRDGSEITEKVGELKNANNLWKGLEQRINESSSYQGITEGMTFLAGDCFLDERLFLPDFDHRFADSDVCSIALSGSTIGQWKTFIRSFSEYQPASLVLSIGTNDVRRGKPADAVVDSLIELITLIHEDMPDTMIYWWNIMPHIGSDEAYYRIMAVNDAMCRYAGQDERLAVVDCYDAMTDENGVADPSLYRDELHPNDAGYDLLFQKTAKAGL